MRLENQLWQCRTHRKMHLELATGARGLEVRLGPHPGVHTSRQVDAFASVKHPCVVLAGRA
jgi:hypothetical protein